MNNYKKAPFSQIKTWIIIIPAKIVTLWNICVIKLKPSTRSRCVIPNNSVTFIPLQTEVAMTYSVTRYDLNV